MKKFYVIRYSNTTSEHIYLTREATTYDVDLARKYYRIEEAEKVCDGWNAQNKYIPSRGLGPVDGRERAGIMTKFYVLRRFSPVFGSYLYLTDKGETTRDPSQAKRYMTVSVSSQALGNKFEIVDSDQLTIEAVIDS